MNHDFTKILSILILLNAFIPQEVAGQVCSCARANLAESQQYSAGVPSKYEIGLSLQYIDLSAVYSDKNALHNSNLNRSSRSLKANLSYRVLNNVTVSSQMGIISQKRSTVSETTTSQGFSDLSFWLKYTPVYSPYEKPLFFTGLGIIAPSGNSDLTLNGLQIANDLQPGSGTWNVSLWLGSVIPMPGFSRILLLTNLVYVNRGSRKQFSNSKQQLNYGNEVSFDNVLLFRHGSSRSYSLGFRFVNILEDRIQSQPVSNSGGNWVYILPGFSMKTFGKFNTNVSGLIPIYTRPNGTQFSTAFGLNISFTFST